MTVVLGTGGKPVEQWAFGIVSEVADIRRKMPILEDIAYFNTGSRGPLSEPVVRAWREALEQEFVLGRQGPWYADARKQARRDLRQGYARLLSVEPATIAITGSTSESMNTVLMAHDWRDGDEIVTTDSEFPSLVTPLSLLAHRFGVVVRVARMPIHADGLSPDQVQREVVDRLAAQINSRTRLLALSHVLYNSGLVLPLKEVTALAHQHGATVMFDGAQSFAAIPIDLAAAGTDYYAFPAQKWLCGPEGLGGLYVASHRLDELLPVSTRTAPTAKLSGDFVPHEGALRYEAASFDLPRLRAATAALEHFGALAPDFAFVRNHALARRFYDGLEAKSYARLVSPHGFASLIGFELTEWNDRAAVARLRELGFAIRRVPCNVLRISFGYFNLESEVDRLLDALDRLVAER